MGKLDEQVAVVIGGGRGLGRIICHTLCREGARVVVAARTASEIEQVAAELRTPGGQAVAVVTDATREEGVRNLASQVRETYGDPDILVNCVGESLIKDLPGTTYEDWHRIMVSNLGSVFLATREFLPLMMERGRGLLVNLSSRAGIYGQSNISVYTAAKSGVIAFTQALSLEARKRGVRVASIAPAPMDTPMRWLATPNFAPERAMRPESVADLVLLMASHPDMVFEHAAVPASVHYY